jgi:Restriction endonuclease
MLDDDAKVAKGTSLEDIVASLIRGWGFDVRTRYRAQDKSGIEHEIDVLGVKKEQFGEVSLAVECKNHLEPIDIKEIRNFRDKLNSLGYTKGLFVSTGGFTPPALEYAASTGIETWGNSKLQENLHRAKAGFDVIPDALPISPDARSFIEPKLVNAAKLQLVELAVSYTPYYFIDYHCFTQDRVNYEITNLESKGLVVIGGLSGGISDSVVYAGVPPIIPRSGNFVQCRPSEARDASRQQVASGFTRVEVVSPSISESQARQTAQLELTKNISQTYTYQGKRGYVVTNERKTIRPKIGDVNIQQAGRVYVPLITATYAIKGAKYQRRIQGTSLRVMEDAFTVCSAKPVHKAFPVAVCEDCGVLLCQKHAKQCKVCGKYLCKEHSIEKGFYSKFYCAEHAPSSSRPKGN